jgi:hypothetical protein
MSIQEGFRTNDHGLHEDTLSSPTLGGALTSENTDPFDINAPVSIKSEKFAGQAVLRNLAEPVYTVAFPHREKIQGKDFIMQFIVSGFKPESEISRTEQIERALGDTHDPIIFRQLEDEEVEALGDLTLGSHNGLYVAPINRGSAIYMRWTKSF